MFKSERGSEAIREGEGEGEGGLSLLKDNSIESIPYKDTLHYPTACFNPTSLNLTLDEVMQQGSHKKFNLYRNPLRTYADPSVTSKWISALL